MMLMDAINAHERRREQAVDWLKWKLKDGPVRSLAIWADVGAGGFSSKQIEYARGALGVRVRRVGGLGTAGAWYWSLPPKVDDLI
jgi:hypothetical protein